MKPPISCLRCVWLTSLILAVPVRSAAQSTGLYDRNDILPLTLRAPLAALLRQDEGAEVDGTLHLEDGTSLPVRLTTYGKSRLRECDLPPLKMTADADAARETPFEGEPTLRVVTHCRNHPSLERYMLLEYLIYRSYLLLAEPALRVRLARFRYEDTDGRSRDTIAHGFFVEDIGLAAARYGRSWSTLETHKVADLDPTHTAFVALFQYMVGNTDWSALRGPTGERCCHNTAVFVGQENRSHLLVPYDLDQSGLVNAPYAAPPKGLGLRGVTQRRYRGFCAHNDELSAVIQIFNGHRAELEALFRDDSLPYPKTRNTALKYMKSFYDEINDPKKLQKKIIGACRG